jgi:hypothetical protein
MVLAMGVGVLNAGKPAEATFPGTNGRIAYANYDGTDYEIYTINPVGGGNPGLPTTIKTTPNLPSRPTARG